MGEGKKPVNKQSCMQLTNCAQLLSWVQLCNSKEAIRASLIAQLVKNLPAMQETPVQFLDWDDSLEKRKATHSSILFWRIPWTVQSMGSQRVGHDWATFTFTATPWTVAHQASLSMGFFRQEYWSGLPFPPSGEPPNPGTEPTSPALAGGFLTTAPPNQVSPLRQVPQKHTAGPSPQVPFTPAYPPGSLVRLIHRGSASP